MDDDIVTLEDSEEETDITKDQKEGKCVGESVLGIININTAEKSFNPVNAGLPLDESCGSFNKNVDDLVGSKDISSLPQKPINPGYAGLPLHDSCGSWMDDIFAAIEDSEDEEEHDTSNIDKFSQSEFKNLMPEEDLNSSIADKVKTSIVGDQKGESYTMNSTVTQNIDDMVEFDGKDIPSLPQKPINPGYAGLPLHDSCGSWMDDSFVTIEDEEELATSNIDKLSQPESKYLTPEEGLNFSIADNIKTSIVGDQKDESNNVNSTVTQIEISDHENMSLLKSGISESNTFTKTVNSAYAGLPVDESCGSWMDDSIVPMSDSENEEELIGSMAEDNVEAKKDNLGLFETIVKVSDKTINSDEAEKTTETIKSDGKDMPSLPQKPVNPGYAGLPLHDSCGSWMDDSFATIEDSEDEEEYASSKIDEFRKPESKKLKTEESPNYSFSDITKTSPIDNQKDESYNVNSTITHIEGSKTMTKTEEKSVNSSYAGLPIDESCGSWMDDSIVPMSDSENEDEPIGIMAEDKGDNVENRKNETGLFETLVEVSDKQIDYNIAEKTIAIQKSDFKEGHSIKEIQSHEVSAASCENPISSQTDKSVNPAYAGLPLDDASGLWMDESITVMSDSENEEGVLHKRNKDKGAALLSDDINIDDISEHSSDELQEQGMDY